MNRDQERKHTLVRIVLLCSLAAGGALMLGVDGVQGISQAGALLLSYGLGLGLGGMAVQFWSCGARRQQAQVNGLRQRELQEVAKAFGIMRQQLATTISTSEHAVIALVDRLNRVHGHVQALQAQASEAVQRSHTLADDSSSSARIWEQTASGLADHLAHYAQLQAECTNRLNDATSRVKSLSPMLTLVAEVAHQTNVLSLNAAIEAARAGPDGASFKVVAAEVRRLSSRSAEAASAITEGVTSAMNSLAVQVAAVEREDESLAKARSDLVAQQGNIHSMNETLASAAEPLTALSSTMQGLVESVLVEVVDALGDLQFQDVTRQLIEQVDDAMLELTGHVQALSGVPHGEGQSVSTSDLIAKWQQGYVMDAQRRNHALMSRPASNAASADAAESAGATLALPKVELF